MGKISAQPHTTLCIQFLDRENNDKNNTLPLGKKIWFTIAWGCVEILPKLGLAGNLVRDLKTLKGNSPGIKLIRQVFLVIAFDQIIPAV